MTSTEEQELRKILSGYASYTHVPKGLETSADLTMDQAVAALKVLLSHHTQKASDIAGLSERRQEVYQIWSGAKDKRFNKNTHEDYIDRLYRRFNDLTDQLIDLTGNDAYVHYDKDKDGAPAQLSPTKDSTNKEEENE